MSARGSNI